MPFCPPRSCLAALLLTAACGGKTGELVLTPPEQPEQAARGECPRERKLDLELPLWDLYVSSQAWDALHEDAFASLKVDALLCVEGRAYPLGLELQGASSRKHLKKSFDLKFGAATPLDEAPFGEPEQLPRILLKGMANDQTLIREALGFAAYRGLGWLTPRVSFANLRINGHYWGLYNLVEPIDHHFVERHGFAPGGHLYKAVLTKEQRADFRPGRDLYEAFEDKSEPPSDSRMDLEALTETLQRTPLRYDAFMRDIDRVFPLTPYIDRMVWIAVTQNGDAVFQNFYLYNVPVDGRDAWTMFPWDSNVAFGAHWARPYAVEGPELYPMVDGGNYFGRRLLRVDELRAQYIARFRELLDTDLHRDVLLEHLAELSTRVRHDLAVDQKRWQREVAPDEAFEVVESFLRERPDILRRELDAFERDAGVPDAALPPTTDDAGAEDG
jgi:hypothetical protein